MGCNTSKAADVITPGAPEQATRKNQQPVDSYTPVALTAAGGAGSGGAAGGAGGPSKSPHFNSSSRSFTNEWKLLEKLGKGQYATVFKGQSKTGAHPASEQIAIKVITKANLTNEDLQALAVEVKAMQMLSSNTNFVKIIDFYDEKDTFYLVMEMVSGGELFDRICEKERYTEREARETMRQMVTALQFAHSRGVAHRDLKPENILLKFRDDDTSIKLADLGFAKIVQPGQMMTTPCGTPGYVAPEILSGKPYGLKCDIWSMGVIFYILLCGYPPFSLDAGQENDQAALFAMIKAGAYKFDPPEWTAISDGAKDLVRRMMTVDPDKRYTAEQILSHPWMIADAEALPDVGLEGTKANLKAFNARRRLKSAINTVRSTVRMRLMMTASRSNSLNPTDNTAAAAAAASNSALAMALINAHRASKQTEPRGPSLPM